MNNELRERAKAYWRSEKRDKLYREVNGDRLTSHEIHSIWLADFAEAETESLRRVCEELRTMLHKIGNIIGGPTCTYAPSIEIKEWRDRAEAISKIVASAKALDTPQETK